MKSKPRSIKWAYLYQGLEQGAQDPKKKWSVIASLLFCMAYFVFLNYSISKEGDFQILDAQNNYDVDWVYLQFEGFGALGRQLYLVSVLIIDNLFAVSYGLGFCWVFIFLLNNSFPQYINMLYKICFFPFLLSIVDLLENISISILLIQYPKISSNLVQIASFFTETKWILLIFIISLLIIAWIAKWMNHKEVLAYKEKTK